MTAKNKQLGTEVQRLQAALTKAQTDNRRSICVYCGKVQQYDEPVSWEVLKEHIIAHVEECPTHPIHGAVEAEDLKVEVQRLREALTEALDDLREGIHSSTSPCHPACRVCTRDLPFYEEALSPSVQPGEAIVCPSCESGWHHEPCLKVKNGEPQ